MNLQQIKIANHQTDCFGDYHSMNSICRSNRRWTPIKEVDEKFLGRQILMRGRIHKIRGMGSKCFFIVLRDSIASVQACAFKHQEMSKQMIMYIQRIPFESIIDIVGIVLKPEKPILNCSQQVQIKVLKYFVVSRAIQKLPLCISDANRKQQIDEFKNTETKELIKHQKQIMLQKQTKIDKEVEKLYCSPVTMKMRLDNRVIDLRTSAKQAIFRLQSGVCQLIRQFLTGQNFIQIHTPKLISQDLGARFNDFKLQYFGNNVHMARSSQYHQQMCIMGDFQRIFQVGPIFRADSGTTHRHLVQFTCIQIDMTFKQHYFEVLDFFCELFLYVFINIEKKFSKFLDEINMQFGFSSFKYKFPVVKLSFDEAVTLLKDNDVKIYSSEDLIDPQYKELGRIVREKYQTDFFIVFRLPYISQSFQTVSCEDDEKYACSFKFFVRGVSVFSGAQRIHDSEILQKRAIEREIDLNFFKNYIQIFKYGAFPHCGGRLGLQRFVMQYCDLLNIRNASLFPRDCHRIRP